MENALKNRSLLLFVFIILFLALLGFYFGILQPSNDEITAQNAEFKTLNNQITILTKKAAEKKAKDTNFSSDKVQSTMPLWDNTEQITLDISKISQANNLEINNLSYTIGEFNSLQKLFANENPIYPEVKEVKIGTTINGTYTQILNWISQVNDLPRLLIIDTISLEKPITSALIENKISAALTLTAYFDPSYKDLVKDILVPSFNK